MLKYFWFCFMPLNFRCGRERKPEPSVCDLIFHLAKPINRQLKSKIFRIITLIMCRIRSCLLKVERNVKRPSSFSYPLTPTVNAWDCKYLIPSRKEGTPKFTFLLSCIIFHQARSAANDNAAKISLIKPGEFRFKLFFLFHHSRLQPQKAIRRKTIKILWSKIAIARSEIKIFHNFIENFLFCFYDGVAKVFPLKQFSIHHPLELSAMPFVPF